MSCKGVTCEVLTVATDEARVRSVGECALAAKKFPNADCPLVAMWEAKELEVRQELVDAGVLNPDGSSTGDEAAVDAYLSGGDQ